MASRRHGVQQQGIDGGKMKLDYFLFGCFIGTIMMYFVFAELYGWDAMTSIKGWKNRNSIDKGDNKGE